MYRVTVSMVQVALNGPFVIAREITFPFLPAAGMLLEEFRDEEDCVRIKDVYYNVEERTLEATVESLDFLEEEERETVFGPERVRVLMANGCRVDGQDNLEDWLRVSESTGRTW